LPVGQLLGITLVVIHLGYPMQALYLVTWLNIPYLAFSFGSLEPLAQMPGPWLAKFDDNTIYSVYPVRDCKTFI
jgi:hypothetical protein